MHRRARSRRPAESLEAYLPEFDAAGTHRPAPAELQVAARADELLDRRFLAAEATAALDRLPDLRKKLDAHVAGCEKCTAFVASYVATPRILRDVTRAAMPEELQQSLIDFLRAQRGEGPNQKT